MKTYRNKHNRLWAKIKGNFVLVKESDLSKIENIEIKRILLIK